MNLKKLAMVFLVVALIVAMTACKRNSGCLFGSAGFRGRVFCSPGFIRSGGVRSGKGRLCHRLQQFLQRQLLPSEHGKIIQGIGGPDGSGRHNIRV